MWADQALRRVLELDFRTVLDVGCGAGDHTAEFIRAGKIVTAMDLRTHGDYLDFHTEPHDLVWCSHVLEHQPNVGRFLCKLAEDCREGGILAITVPPLKHEIVGGHVSLWNAGLLLYRMVLAGLDCKGIRLKTYGYNISAILVKRSIELPRLAWDAGDIDRLAGFMPCFAAEGFNGDIAQWNW